MKKKGECLSLSGRTIRARDATGDPAPGLGIKSANSKHPLWFTDTHHPGQGSKSQSRPGPSCTHILRHAGVTQSPGKGRNRHWACSNPATQKWSVAHYQPAQPWWSKDWVSRGRFFRKHAVILPCLCFGGGETLKGQNKANKKTVKTHKALSQENPGPLGVNSQVGCSLASLPQAFNPKRHLFCSHFNISEVGLCPAVKVTSIAPSQTAITME